VVTGLEAGDVACYLSLKDDRGAAFQEMADFSICEQESLVGKRVTLTYKLEKVLADSCQGDPACKDTKTVALVTAVKPLAGKAGAGETGARESARADLVLHADGRRHLRLPDRHEARLRVRVEGRDREQGVCAVPLRQARLAGSPRDGSPRRRGRAVPGRHRGERARSRAAGERGSAFRKADTAYVVYSGIGKWGPKGETMEKQGVVVERGNATLASLPCTGPLLGELGPDWFERAGVQSKGEDFLFPDPPATKRR
jgi:hypothetical protein